MVLHNAMYTVTIKDDTISEILPYMMNINFVFKL